MSAVAINTPGFDPAFHTVHVGDTVTWTNNTGATQALHFGGQANCPPDQSILDAGTYSFQFGVTGHYTFSYGTKTGAVQVI